MLEDSVLFGSSLFINVVCSRFVGVQCLYYHHYIEIWIKYNDVISS